MRYRVVDFQNTVSFFWAMRILVLCIFLFCYFPSFTQGEVVGDAEDTYMEDVSRVHFFEANFSMYSPLDAFSEKISRDFLYGFSIAYLLQLQKEKPSFLGFEAFHMNLGVFNKNYDVVVGNETLELSGKVASNALGLNVIYRHYPPLKWKRFEPYFEGQFGMKFLYSYLSETGAFLDEEPYENFDFLTTNWVLTYGGAFGTQIHISDFYYLNLKTSYHFAVSGEYERRLTENLDMIDFPQEAFETVQSSTNMIKIDLGMTFLF